MSAISAIGGSSAYANASGIREIMALRQQIIDRSSLLQQVRQPQMVGSAQSAQGSFADAVQHALNSVNTSQQRAETITNAFETGQTQDVAQVMLARQQASIGFEATLQVRNKLLSAYQEIMKFGV